jgi:hypothetical protein
MVPPYTCPPDVVVVVAVFVVEVGAAPVEDGPGLGPTVCTGSVGIVDGVNAEVWAGAFEVKEVVPAQPVRTNTVITMRLKMAAYIFDFDILNPPNDDYGSLHTSWSHRWYPHKNQTVVK